MVTKRYDAKFKWILSTLGNLEVELDDIGIVDIFGDALLINMGVGCGINI
jgi:hypothetical protein